MKTLVVTLLLLSFHSYAMAEKGFVVKIFPDKLTFPIDCETRADFQAEELSILYICKNSINQNYFFNFRPNNIDIAACPCQFWSLIFIGSKWWIVNSENGDWVSVSR